MPLSPDIKLAIASVSLGQHPTHTIPRKFAAAAAAHFAGIELVYKDLVSFSESHSVSLVEGASRIKDIAAEYGLEIVSINPFKMFEGHLGVPLEQRLGAVSEWVRIARALGTRIIQIPSQMDPNSSDGEDIIISDLRAMADVGAAGGDDVISFAYEAVAFGVHNCLWEDSLRIVEKVDRDNFGICLDNFHVHAKLWGDCMVQGGRIPGGEEALRKSLKRFLELCPKGKVFYIQLSGGKSFDPPMKFDDELFEGLEIKDPRLAWSRGARPFPLDGGDYFPIMDIVKIWLEGFGWDGWVSMEGFLEETKREGDDFGPEAMARRGWESWEKIKASLDGG